MISKQLRTFMRSHACTHLQVINHNTDYIEHRDIRYPTNIGEDCSSWNPLTYSGERRKYNFTETASKHKSRFN